MRGSYLGPQFSNSEIEDVLKKIGAHYIRLPKDEVIQKTAAALTEGKAVSL